MSELDKSQDEIYCFDCKHGQTLGAIAFEIYGSDVIICAANNENVSFEKHCCPQFTPY